MGRRGKKNKGRKFSLKDGNKLKELKEILSKQIGRDNIKVEGGKVIVNNIDNKNETIVVNIGPEAIDRLIKEEKDNPKFNAKSWLKDNFIKGSTGTGNIEEGIEVEKPNITVIPKEKT